MMVPEVKCSINMETNERVLIQTAPATMTDRFLVLETSHHTLHLLESNVERKANDHSRIYVD